MASKKEAATKTEEKAATKDVALAPPQRFEKQCANIVDALDQAISTGKETLHKSALAGLRRMRMELDRFSGPHARGDKGIGDPNSPRK